MFETVIVEFDEKTGVGKVTLNRPESLNALTPELRRELVEGLQWLESHNEETDGVVLRAVILEGSEGNFSAGADVNAFGDASPGARSEPHYRDFIMGFPAPIIAKIRGYCLGGGLETAMACDFRFAHEDSQLGLPEVDLGIMPGDGVQFISRLADTSVAKEFAMTGEHFSPERAQELGIVNRIYESDEILDDSTREFAETIAKKPPLAIQAIKDSANLVVRTELQEGRKYDGQQGELLRMTEDFEKATRAFAEDDYEPEFEGR